MDKKEIVKKFIEKGILLSPSELENIDESNYIEVLEKHGRTPSNENLTAMNSAAADITVIPKETGGDVVKTPEKKAAPEETKKPQDVSRETAETLTEIKKNPEEANKHSEDVKIEICGGVKEKKLNAGDFIRYYSKKYDGLRELLSRKINAVSINKAGGIKSTFTVIGMVKEKSQNGFVLEDKTGSIEIISYKEPVKGDVVAVSGISREGKIIEKEIIYPDIPLTHKPRSVAAEIDIESIAVKLPNPAHIKAKKGEKEAFILAYSPLDSIEETEAVEVLKKRHLSPKRGEICFNGNGGDPFLIEPIPDVLLITENSGNDFVKNYKGVTVISTGRKVKSMDLMTKKAEFI